MLNSLRYVWLGLAIGVFSASAVHAAPLDDMLRMSEQLDQMDKAEFDMLVGKADGCTRQRNFTCADGWIAQAAKLANSAQDRSALAQARQRVAGERAEAAREEQVRLAELDRQRQEERAAREQEERMQACDARCSDPGELSLCYRRLISPNRCTDGDDGSSVNYGAAILSGVNSALAGKARIDAIHNQTMARAQERVRQEQMQRMRDEQQAQRERIQQEARDRERRAERERQTRNAAAPARAADTAGTRVASADSGSGGGGGGLSQGALPGVATAGISSNAGNTARAVAASQKAEQEAQEHQAREQKERAERQAKLDAEKAAETHYLAQMRSGIRLQARQCFGKEQRIVGTRPRIAPETVSCVDVHYRAYCSSNSQQAVEGVGTSFVGASTDCFMGDAFPLSAPLSCDVKDIQVIVRDVRVCGK